MFVWASTNLGFSRPAYASLASLSEFAVAVVGIIELMVGVSSENLWISKCALESSRNW